VEPVAGMGIDEAARSLALSISDGAREREQLCLSHELSRPIRATLSGYAAILWQFGFFEFDRRHFPPSLFDVSLVTIVYQGQQVVRTCATQVRKNGA